MPSEGEEEVAACGESMIDVEGGNASHRALRSGVFHRKHKGWSEKFLRDPGSHNPRNTRMPALVVKHNGGIVSLSVQLEKGFLIHLFFNSLPFGIEGIQSFCDGEGLSLRIRQEQCHDIAGI